MPESKRRAFEAELASLSGRSIRAVSYFELDQGQPSWGLESPIFDSLDFGLTLHLDDGSDFSFTWGAEFSQFGVSVSRERAPGGLGRDATPRWQRLLGHKVRSVSVTWENEADEVYPQSVRLELEGGAQVIVSAFESQGGRGSGHTDHITVFFSDEDAARAGA